MKKGLRNVIAALAGLLCFMESPTYAACTVTATDLNFGAYDTLSGTPKLGTSNVHVHCTGLLSLFSYRVYFNTGNSGTYSTREMDRDTTYSLGYNLYTTSDYQTTVWGDGSSGTGYASGTILQILIPYDADFTVYGSIPINQNVPPGTYTDTITATMQQVGGGVLSTDAFTVTSSVAASCTVSADDMNFGAYNPTSSTGASAESDIRVKCTDTTDYNVSLNVGIGVGASYTGRKMTGVTDNTKTLIYNLYTTNGYATVWGDGTGSTAIVAGQGDGLVSWVTPNVHTVYGRMPAFQDVLPQTYQDTITVTVEY